MLFKKKKCFLVSYFKVRLFGVAYIDDSQTNQNAYIGDLEDQASGNYDYDPIGNLTQDVRDSITDISWTNYQKISAIEKTDRTIRFRYNPMQQRVAKYVRVGDAEKRTYYVRDAQGNVMAAYSAWMDLGAGITWDSVALSGVMLYPTLPINPLTIILSVPTEY